VKTDSRAVAGPGNDVMQSSLWVGSSSSLLGKTNSKSCCVGPWVWLAQCCAGAVQLLPNAGSAAAPYSGRPTTTAAVMRDGQTRRVNSSVV
jgi:hypothetical protein